ncbi:MAG: ABC transporter ATP-binding protein [Phycisphaeraceae bacterium]|nr:ABC transporter ATP-binding protein [Phycisphaeraceae bacterium]
MSEAVIQFENLTHWYGKHCAVDQVSLAVPRGSVFALLGRNGSGKSTMIRALLGLQKPTRGRSRVFGEDSMDLAPQTRGRIGYLAEGHPLFGWMKVGEAERFERSFYDSWNERMFAAVVEHFRIGRKQRGKDLSRGQRAGLALALTLASEPEVLVLDDPAMGLDPVARQDFLESIVLTTRDSGRTVFFSSHILADVERVADHVAILDQGVLRVCCPMEVFRQKVRRVVATFKEGVPAGKLPDIPGLLYAVRCADELSLVAVERSGQKEAIWALGPAAVTEEPISLDEAVIAYLGEHGVRTSLLEKIGGGQ